MRVFSVTASSEHQQVGALRSFYLMTVRDGDERSDEWRTRGDVARERFVASFLGDEKYGDEDGILLTDADQRHPKDMLEKLRDSMEAHNFDMVCAHYYRRETKPIQSLCYEVGDGTFPFLPMLDVPREGLHEIAITGFGCVLIKKKVLKAVQKILPEGMSPIAIGPLPEVAKEHSNWGPDFRFFYLARKCGYRLWLNAEVESLHATTLWLGHKSAAKLIDYTGWANAAQIMFEEERLGLNGMSPEAFRQRERILEARKRGLLQELDGLRPTLDTPEGQQKAQELSMALYMMDGRLAEMGAWIEWAEKYPAIERPDQLPTKANTPPMDVDGIGAAKERDNTHKLNALDLIGELPDVGSNDHVKA